MNWLFIVGLALASSIDNLAVGFSYGLSEIRIGAVANLGIAMVCLMMSLAGGDLGVWIGSVLPGSVPDLIGAALLLLLGIRILWMVLRIPPSASQGGQRARPVVGPLEALVLGVSLSANAAVNSVGGGIMQISPMAVAIAAALGSYLAIALGEALGSRTRAVHIGSANLGRYVSVLGGSLLIALAVMKVLK